MDVGWPDPAEWPPQLHERLPLVVNLAELVNGDHGDLEHPVPASVEAGGLEVDDREAGESHESHHTQGVPQSERGRSAPPNRIYEAFWWWRARMPIGAETV